MDFLKQNNPKKMVENFLKRKTKPPVISLYLKTSPVWDENEKSRIKLKNTLSDIEDFLDGAGFKKSETKELLRPLWDIQKDLEYWKEQQNGLGLFRSEDYLEEIKISDEVETQFYISNRPNVKALTPYLLDEQRYYVLSLSYKNVDLYRGVNKNWQKLDPLILPEDLEDILRVHDTEKHRKTHTVGSGAIGSPPVRSPHGHGTRDTMIDEQTKVFVDEVDKALRRVVGKEEDPYLQLLILASERRLYDAFMKYSKYSKISHKFVEGSPAKKSPKEILKGAWEIVKKSIEERKETLLEHYKEHKALKETAEDLSEVVRASFENRIEILFVDPKITLWGSFDPEKGLDGPLSERDYNTYDLVNYAIVNVLLSGGRVLAFESDRLSTECGMAAILRY